MSVVDDLRTAPEDQFWAQLDANAVGMLGVEGSYGHLQPMTHFVDREKRRLWFFSMRSSPLVRAIGDGGAAHYALTTREKTYYACARGTIVQDLEPGALDRFWGPPVAVWYPGGRDDPELALLRMDLRDGVAWATVENGGRALIEFATASVAGREPNIGATASLNFL